MTKQVGRIILIANFVINVYLHVQKIECKSHNPNSLTNTILRRKAPHFKRNRDVLQVSQPPKLKSRIAFDEDENSPFVDEWDQSKDQRYIFSRNSKSNQSKADSFHDRSYSKDMKRSGNPVVYRYFGRNRARSVRAESVPFIVICSCVDHWKVVGKILASRGFNMIAVERSKQSENIITSSRKTFENNIVESEDDDDTLHEGEALVLSILETLKWQKAILVGCDQECVLALEAALRLEDRIVGLMMCGDLSTVIEYAHNEMKSLKLSKEGSLLDIEIFLEHFVDCPCQLVCDGGITRDGSTSSITKTLLGGGIVPHRRLPEQLSWLFTRFVEQKVSLRPGQPNEKETIGNDVIPADDSEIRSHQQRYAPGMFLVFGRAFATMLIYLSVAKVAIFQYRNIQNIQFDFSTILDMSKWQIVRNAMNKVKDMEWKKMIPLSFFRRHMRRGKSDDFSEKKIDDSSFNSNVLGEEDILEGQKEEIDSNSDQQHDDDKDATDRKEETENDGENQGGNTRTPTNPLLQKLLFFDQIIS